MVPKVNYCFKCRFSNVSASGFHVNEQYIEVSKCAMPLGHSISSSDGTDIVKYAKKSFWNRFNISRADFGHISTRLKMYYFKNMVVFSMDHHCGL